jgi:hypothetical protein
MRKFYFLPSLTLLVVGCSASPTAPRAIPHEFPTARYENGGMVGSGNIVDPAPSVDETTTTSAPLSAEAATDSIGRNGGMVGSGN